jgi:hypothetical protein
METIAEKRCYQRQCYSADIAFSYFNKEPSYEAETLNFGKGGMCFKSHLHLQPGAILFIRLQKIHSNSAGTGVCKALRLVALAEVKWCNEISGAKELPYGVGVKYFEPAY